MDRAGDFARYFINRPMGNYLDIKHVHDNAFLIILRKKSPRDAEAVARFNTNYRESLKECLRCDPTIEEDDMEMVARPHSPWTMNDDLVHKKRPRPLLTLSEGENNSTYTRSPSQFLSFLFFRDVFSVLDR